MHSGKAMRAERLKKLQILRDAGIDPYPAISRRSDSISNFLNTFDARMESGQKVVLAGRLLSIRKQGGIIFADLFDGTGKIQIILQKEAVGEAFDLFDKTVDQGDFVEVEGAAYVTKRQEKSLLCASWRMLAKALSPLPDQWYGLENPELKLRERYLDILFDPDLRALFERRAKFWQTIRNFYLERGFLEVETPALESSPGGAEARPFETHHHALDIDISLRISLELWLK